MITNEIIAFSFKLINFGALIALGIYLFAKKLKKPIQTKIEEKEVFWQNLKTNEKMLIDQQHKLSMELSLQEQEAQNLLKKIARWHATAQEQQEVLNRVVQENANKAFERSITANHHEEIRLLLQKIVPRALENVHVQLEEYFADLQHAENYLHSIVNGIKKSDS